jgi:hypothetical protein
MAFSESLLYIRQLAATAISVWFVAWALRRRYELDIQLKRSEQIARWIVVAGCLAMTLLPGPQFAAVRVVAGIIGISFLAWPNLGHHVMKLFGR